MGSSTKKHKKDRDSKKHKHRSRSRSPAYSPDSRDKDKSLKKHNHHKQDPPRTSLESKEREREREREKRHRVHKKHKDRKHKHRSRSVEQIVTVDNDSDSSDVVEVPLAPPAPVISKEKVRPPPPIISKERVRVPPPAPIISRKSRSKSPIPENGAGDCLSIEETNKLRAKLGLKPLEVESSVPVKDKPGKKNAEGLSSFKDEWGEFLHKPAANIAEKLKADKIRDKIKQRKEKRALEEKLKKVKALGESDEEGDDVHKWLERSKKRDDLRKEAERRAKMLEEMDAEFGVGTIVDQEIRNAKRQAYRDNDLKGLRVDHDVNEFSEGRSIILTLKDKDVLDEQDDALVNVNLMDEERYKKNVVNKKLNPLLYGYDVYEETVDEFGQPIERSILGKYDEEIEGQQKKTFTIGENMDEERAHQRKLLEIRTKLAGKKLESLDENILQLASDTYTATELEKFKKPKKKVKKMRQKLKAEDLEAIATESFGSRDTGRRNRTLGGGGGGGGGVRKRLLDTDDVPAMNEDLSNIKVDADDEDDLERVLSKARKLKQIESIIRKNIPVDPNEIKDEIKEEPESDAEMNEVKDGHIILNSTAEFCRTLGDIPTYGMAGNRDEDSNDIMDFDNDIIEPEPPIISAGPSTGTWNSVNPDAIARSVSDDNSNDVSDVAILDEEPDVGSGVAAALRLAMSKGYLEKDDKNRPSNSRMAHLQAKNYSIEDKAYGEEDKFGRRDRYHTGPIMDFKERDTFKPNVKLEYIDDNGRVLNAKEAFRYLSHKFHGKGPGKNKIEKRLKKMEQEGLMMKMSSTDTPLGTLNMLQQKQKETQSAFVVLSGSKQSNIGTSIAKHK